MGISTTPYAEGPTGDHDEAEPMPDVKSRHQQLVDPAAELEIVQRQRKLLEAKHSLEREHRMAAMEKRWDVAWRLAVPAAAVILGVALVAVALLVLNWVGAGFWSSTHWS